MRSFVPRYSFHCVGLVFLLAVAAPSSPVGAAEAETSPARAFSGFSLGIGGGTGNETISVGEGSGVTKADVSDGEVWFFANYNRAVDDHWILGIDVEFTLIGDVNPDDPDIPPGIFKTSLFDLSGDGTAGVSLRSGYAFDRRLLGYVRAGWMLATIGGPDFNGVQVAGGVEWRLSHRLALRAEVAHDFLETRRLGASRTKVAPRITTGRAGISYRF